MSDSDDIFSRFLEFRGIERPAASAANPSPSATASAAPPTAPADPFTVTTSLPVGETTSYEGLVNSNQKLFDQLTQQHRTNGIVETNLRNLSDIYRNLQTGIGVPYETPAGKLLVQFGFDPKKFGLTPPAYAEEAKKAASAALYATMQQAPNLVADIEERKNLKPGITLEPDAAHALINNGLLNVAVGESQLGDMGAHLDKHEHLRGYRPDKFTPDVPGLQERIYQTLPAPKGGGQIEPPSGRPVAGTSPIVKPTTPMATPAPRAPAAPAGLPTGAVQIGTMGGKPVYADPKDPKKRWVIE